MVEVSQTYQRLPKPDFPRLLSEQFDKTGLHNEIKPGMRIAVGVGSRGIANLKEVVKSTLDLLITAGARPFVVPAMGSHGGANSEGQAKVLAGYGITPEGLGVPVETSMAVQKIGTSIGGHDVVFSVPALRAEGVIVINRVKPHTDFRGTLGSGIQKMLTIGFGKETGAANAHRAAAHLGHETVIREFAKVVLERVSVLCAIALVEDQHHQTAVVKVLRRDAIPSEETLLLQQARLLMPRLPLDEIDLLIVDLIGKEISGTGMDTNVIGREISGYSTSLLQGRSVTPHISRIFVRDLSPATNGNGLGLGLADFTTSRAVKALNKHYTYVNAVTSIGLQPAKIPIHFETDRETVCLALETLTSQNSDALRVVRIVNTLDLDRMLVSEGCLGVLRDQRGLAVTGTPKEMEFDNMGNLLPF
jgi:hypothetical protein